MFCVRRTSSSAVALLLCTVLALSGTIGETENISSTCALKCKVSPGKTEAKCTLPADPQKLDCSSQDYENILRNVSSLDLSDNRLTRIPTWLFPHCENLTKLTLAINNIKEIEAGALASLDSLEFLNVSFNDLREWEVNPVNELQGLNYLDVTGNQHWLPSEQFLQLSNLTTVKGVRLSPYCQDCSLCKINAGDVNCSCRISDRRLSSPSGWPWHDEIKYGKALDFIKHGFWPSCLEDEACLKHQHDLPTTKALYDITIKATFALYATGSVALLVNIAVVVFIVINKSLRANLAVRLVLNIAVCDVLIGLVSIVYARVFWGKTFTEYLFGQLQGNHYDSNDLKNNMEKQVNIMGPILTCAVASHVFASVILMLDKFLKIVFAMKPDVRLERKTALILLSLSWSLSVTFAILPVFSVGQTTYTDIIGLAPLPYDQARMVNGELVRPVGFAAGSQIALVIIQLTSFVLYLPIFIVAKKSGANVGIKRDAAIARKIALLVFTNLIFFTVPVVIGAFQRALWSDRTKVLFGNWKIVTLGEQQWSIFAVMVLPILCLSINSVLNPFLYALRHPKIKQQVDPLISRCITAMRECFTTLRENPRCLQPTNVEPATNEVEMQEVRNLQSHSHGGQHNQVEIQGIRL